jgi:hypothetical protein
MADHQHESQQFHEPPASPCKGISEALRRSVEQSRRAGEGSRPIKINKVPAVKRPKGRTYRA